MLVPPFREYNYKYVFLVRGHYNPPPKINDSQPFDHLYRFIECIDQVRKGLILNMYQYKSVIYWHAHYCLQAYICKVLNHHEHSTYDFNVL